MFERIDELVAGMTAESRRRVPALNNWELSRRMRQLDFLFERARSSATAAARLADDEAKFEAAREVAVTYAEAFYLFAWRVRTSLTRGDPLGPFDPEGVNRVRNLLIEHPEHGGPPLPSWVLSGERDIRLAIGGEWANHETAVRRGPFKDQGLLANATEFKTMLEELLERHERPD